MTAEDGIHIFNRDGHHISRDALSLYPKLAVEADGAHAFYLGAELAKAEIAFALGKRYTQDEPLDFGLRGGQARRRQGPSARDRPHLAGEGLMRF